MLLKSQLHKCTQLQAIPGDILVLSLLAEVDTLVLKFIYKGWEPGSHNRPKKDGGGAVTFQPRPFSAVGSRVTTGASSPLAVWRSGRGDVWMCMGQSRLILFVNSAE